VLVFGISHLAIVRTFWVLEKVNELNQGQTFAGKKVRTKRNAGGGRRKKK